IESLLLAIAGGAAGVIIGGWVLAYLSRGVIIPIAFPLWVDLPLGASALLVRTARVVLQVAISVVVLVCAGLMVRASITAQHVDPGFRTDRVLLASLTPGLAQLTAEETRGC